jgi:hypothetical protein
MCRELAANIHPRDRMVAALHALAEELEAEAAADEVDAVTDVSADD